MLSSRKNRHRPASRTADMGRSSTPGFDTETSEQVELATTIANDSDGEFSGDDNAALLQRLLMSDADLALWLEHTGFFDIDHRERVLSGLRKLKAMDEERAKLLHEINCTAGGLIYSPSIKASSSRAASRKPTPLSSSIPVASSTPASATSYVPGDCAADGDVDPSLPMPAAHVENPDPVGENARFFLVKSYNLVYITLSQRDSLWVTQSKNKHVFTGAFRECDDVILFFSANGSHCFQGFARMKSFPDRDLPKPDWIQNINLPYKTDPFRVEWMNMTETSFNVLGDLKNPLNENQSITLGRDGQEYPAELGRKMMEIMEAPDQKPSRSFAQKQQHNLSLLWGSSRDHKPTRSRSDFAEEDDGKSASADRNWRQRARSTVKSPQPPLNGDNLIDY